MIVKAVETDKEMNDALYVRSVVFVEEQHVPVELEIDEHENHAIHFIVYNDEEKPIGAGRLRKVDNGGKIERISVLREFRNKGLGRLLMQKIEQTAKEKQWLPLLLNAQIQVETFYKSLGYSTCSETFMEAGIPHVSMKKVNFGS
ncbi:GNAT family N-acetyltransferase [Pueribacillus theae]|uniref:GNAT family N-acetyltransferase n=1 Tax=Pueribacillus theae TaxID=2171751 RepID=A0A2U1K7A1_9BACI|nr:GNAT family N-acetyltransferase [Pueribacillus theae]PWA12758.1 GNAT family N-acetyltransferase [Pueribacillus theae]